MLSKAFVVQTYPFILSRLLPRSGRALSRAAQKAVYKSIPRWAAFKRQNFLEKGPWLRGCPITTVNTFLPKAQTKVCATTESSICYFQRTNRVVRTIYLGQEESERGASVAN